MSAATADTVVATRDSTTTSNRPTGPAPTAQDSEEFDQPNGNRTTGPGLSGRAHPARKPAYGIKLARAPWESLPAATAAGLVTEAASNLGQTLDRPNGNRAMGPGPSGRAHPTRKSAFRIKLAQTPRDQSPGGDCHESRDRSGFKLWQAKSRTRPTRAARGPAPRRRLRCSPVTGTATSWQLNCHQATGSDPCGRTPQPGSWLSRPGPSGRPESTSGW